MDTKTFAANFAGGKPICNLFFLVYLHCQKENMKRTDDQSKIAGTAKMGLYQNKCFIQDFSGLCLTG